MTDAPAPATIRRATPADVEALARLSYDTFRETFLEGFAIPYPPEDLARFVEDAYSVRAVGDRLADPGQASWIAEAHGRALGYASAGPCHLPHAEARRQDGELHRLYVSRDAQGTGLGRRLLETALDWLGEAFGGSLWIGVWSGNLKAQKLYAHYGFAKAGEYQFPVGRWRDDEIIMRRG